MIVVVDIKLETLNRFGVIDKNILYKLNRNGIKSLIDLKNYINLHDTLEDLEKVGQKTKTQIYKLYSYFYLEELDYDLDVFLNDAKLHSLDKYIILNSGIKKLNVFPTANIIQKLNIVELKKWIFKFHLQNGTQSAINELNNLKDISSIILFDITYESFLNSNAKNANKIIELYEKDKSMLYEQLKIEYIKTLYSKSKKAKSDRLLILEIMTKYANILSKKESMNSFLERQISGIEYFHFKTTDYKINTTKKELTINCLFILRAYKTPLLNHSKLELFCKKLKFVETKSISTFKLSNFYNPSMGKSKERVRQILNKTEADIDRIFKDFDKCYERLDLNNFKIMIEFEEQSRQENIFNLQHKELELLMHHIMKKAVNKR